MTKILLARNGILSRVKVLVNDDIPKAGDIAVCIDPRDPDDVWDLFRCQVAETPTKKFVVLKVLMFIK